jgi:anaerobic selenocysteine-containing dehydrogenase
MRPLHQTRSMPDVILEISRRLSPPINPALPGQTYEEILQATFSKLPAQGADVWTTAQQQGGWWNTTPQKAAASPAAPGGKPITAAEAEFDGPANEYPFHFLPYASQAFLDGSLAHLPWLQELPDVLTTAMWSSWVEINPETAGRLGIAGGDMVEITSAHGSVHAPAVLYPGIAPDVIAMPVGQGHETFTRYASGRGSNPMRILAPVIEPETGSLAWAATRVKISKAAGESNLILFAGSLRENKEQHR